MHKGLLKFAQSMGDETRNYCSPLGEPLNVIPFNQRKDYQQNSQGKWLHFFLDDERFEAIWNNPVRYYKRFASMNVAGLIGFDFSIYDDYPGALNYYNLWRNSVLTRFFALALEVPAVPVSSWNTQNPEFSTIHIEDNSAVAIGSYPLLRGNQQGYMAGLTELMKVVKPAELHIFGNIPPNIRFSIPVFRYDLHYQKLNKAKAKNKKLLAV